jgi:hypothetical protein
MNKFDKPTWDTLICIKRVIQNIVDTRYDRVETRLRANPSPEVSKEQEVAKLENDRLFEDLKDEQNRFRLEFHEDPTSIVIIPLHYREQQK